MCLASGKSRSSFRLPTRCVSGKLWKFPQAAGDPEASYVTTSHSTIMAQVTREWILVLLPGMVALLLYLISSWAKPMKQHWTDVRPCGLWNRPSGATASKVSPTSTLAVRNCCLGSGVGGTCVKSVQVLLNTGMEVRVPGDW